jgi:uncharacterized protein YcbX
MRVSAINIYPIKSVGAISCEQRVVERQGLSGDRRFMLVDEQGRFITQRQFPRMALIRSEPISNGYRFSTQGLDPLELPVQLFAGEQVEVKVWKDTPRALLADSTINDWFTQALGLTCRLVFLTDEHRRRLDNGHGRAEDRVSFADSAPLLLTSEASLKDLNHRLVKPVSMARFRPNLVVDADTPYAEDDWQMIAVGECEFEVAWSCSRCLLTTVDPASGERDAGRQPLATLKSYRDAPDGPLFGRNLIPRKLGRISVGDPVRVL